MGVIDDVVLIGFVRRWDVRRVVSDMWLVWLDGGDWVVFFFFLVFLDVMFFSLLR